MHFGCKSLNHHHLPWLDAYCWVVSKYVMDSFSTKLSRQISFRSTWNTCSSWVSLAPWSVLHSHPVDQDSFAVHQCSHAEPAFPWYKATALHGIVLRFFSCCTLQITCQKAGNFCNLLSNHSPSSPHFLPTNSRVLKNSLFSRQHAALLCNTQSH